MRIGWRQPAAGAARPGVGGEQGGATGAELAVCDRVRKRSKGSVGRNICAGGSPVLRNTLCSGCGRERAQTVYTAVLRQPQAVLPAGQTAKDMRNKARHAVVLWVTCRRGKAARPVCPASVTRSKQRATSRTQLGWAVLRADQGYALSGGCVDKSAVGNS